MHGAPTGDQRQPICPMTTFLPGRATHPAREAWLLHELETWLAGDRPCQTERRRIVAGALRTAVEDAHDWLDGRLDGTDVVRVDLRVEGPDRDRHSVFRKVPSPLGLLLICLDQCRVGDEVTLTQELAKAGRVEARATWPFGMAEAEELTRPADLRAAARAMS